MRNSSVDWRRLRETSSTLVKGTKMASVRPRTATTVLLPAWRQQLSSRRGWPASRTSTCQGSGSRPRGCMTCTAGGGGAGGADGPAAPVEGAAAAALVEVADQQDGAVVLLGEAGQREQGT